MKIHFKWAYLAVPLFAVFILSTANGLPIPELTVEQSRVFIIVKGVFAATGVILLLWHMWRESPHMKNMDQRLRYLLLLAYGTLSAYATIEQVEENTVVSLRHYGGMVLAISLVAVSIYSMKEMKKYRDNLGE